MRRTTRAPPEARRFRRQSGRARRLHRDWLFRYVELRLSRKAPRRRRRQYRHAGLRLHARRLRARDHVINDARQRWLFRMVNAAAAPGEDGALLAQPLRDRVHEDCRRARRRPKATRMHGGQAVRGSRRAKGQIELFREHALGNFRDLLIAVAKDPAMLVWLDGRTNVASAAAGELRARADGAVHDGRRHVHRDGRLRRRARVHRLEPARVAVPAPTQLLRVQLQRRRSTTRPRRSSRSRSTRTAARTIPARAGRRGHAGRHRPDQRASRAHPADRPAAGAEAVCTSSSARSTPPDPTLDRRGRRRSTTAATSRSKPVVRAAAAVAAVPRPGESATARYSWPVEFVVRAIKEVGWVGFSVERRADAAGRTWASSCSSRPTSNGWELGPRLVLDRRDAGAHELRRRSSATNQKFNLRDAAAAQAGDRRTRCVALVLDRLSPAPFDAAPHRRRCSTTCEPAAPGPAPTRSSPTRRPASSHLIVGSGEYQLDVGDATHDHHHDASSSRAASRRSLSASPRRAFLSDLARAQGASRRNLVVLYLSGGNDALSTLIPYTDPATTAPPADDRDPGRQRAADRHATRAGARSASIRG